MAPFERPPPFLSILKKRTNQWRSRPQAFILPELLDSIREAVLISLPRSCFLFILLGLIMVVAFGLSLSLGQIHLAPMDVLQALAAMMGWSESPGQAALVLEQLRLPRALMGAAAGAILAVSGVAMQGLFRNPLADPGLIGVSSGAALGAAMVIVFGTRLFSGLPPFWSPYLLTGCAFIGGLMVTALVYRIGRRKGHTSVATMLLAGIALTAISGAVVGLLTYLADDGTLRTLTFWNMGSLNGASYRQLWPVLAVMVVLTAYLPRRADALNALLLGESEARHLGFDVERLKAELIFCTALGVGTAVAAVGLIGFVGLVVPHLIRLISGPDHRALIPAALMGGATLLLLADLVARMALSPAELPIGIVTALIGGPFFLYLLLKGTP